MDVFFGVMRTMCDLIIVSTINVNLRLVDLVLHDTPVSYTTAVLYSKRQAYLNFRLLFWFSISYPPLALGLNYIVGYQQDLSSDEVLHQVFMWVVYAVLFCILRSSRQNSLEVVERVANGSLTIMQDTRTMTPPNSASSSEAGDSEHAGLVTEDVAEDLAAHVPLARHAGLVTEDGAEDLAAHYVPLASDSE